VGTRSPLKDVNVLGTAHQMRLAALKVAKSTRDIFFKHPKFSLSQAPILEEKEMIGCFAARNPSDFFQPNVSRTLTRHGVAGKGPISDFSSFIGSRQLYMRVFHNVFSFEGVEYPRVVRVEKGSRTIGLNYQSSAFPFKLVPRKKLELYPALSALLQATKSRKDSR